MPDKYKHPFEEPLGDNFKHRTMREIQQAKTRVMRVNIPSALEIEFSNSDIAKQVYALCSLLLDHGTEVKAYQESESQFEQASALIHAEINRLIAQFRMTCKTSYTDYQLVEFFLLNARERWILDDFCKHLEHISVDDGGEGSCLPKCAYLQIRGEATLRLNYWRCDQVVEPEKYYKKNVMQIYDLHAANPLPEFTEKRIHVEYINCAMEVYELFQTDAAYTEEGSKKVNELLRWFQENRVSYLSDYEALEAMYILCTPFDPCPDNKSPFPGWEGVGGCDKQTYHYRLYTYWDGEESHVCRDFMWKFFLLPVEMPL